MSTFLNYTLAAFVNLYNFYSLLTRTIVAFVVILFSYFIFWVAEIANTTCEMIEPTPCPSNESKFYPVCIYVNVENLALTSVV